MHRGYYKRWRKELDSDLWDRPPLYLKVWDWLLASVDYQTGSITCTMDHIADRVQWQDKGHPCIPSRKMIHDILHWMENHSMVTIAIGGSKLKHTTVSICKWHLYQSGKDTDGNVSIYSSVTCGAQQGFKKVQEIRREDIYPAHARETERENPIPEKPLQVALDFVQSWNTTFPKTVNRQISQLEDQNAVQRALEMEHKSIGDLIRIRDWIKANGKDAFWPRPKDWFGYTTKNVRVIDQIDREMEIERTKTGAKNGRSGKSNFLTIATGLEQAAGDILNRQLRIVGPQADQGLLPESTDSR